MAQVIRDGTHSGEGSEVRYEGETVQQKGLFVLYDEYL